MGTSGRVFPKAMKTSPLLRAWLARLAAMKAAFRPRHRWTGWDAEARPVFDTPDGRVSGAADVILALGGASWPQAWLGWALGRAFRRAGHCGFAAEAVELRLRSGVLRIVPRALRGPAAERASRFISKANACAARPSSPKPGLKAARSMRCRRHCAMRSSATARPSLPSTCGRACRPPLWSERFPSRAANNPCRTSCGKPSSYRPLPRAAARGRASGRAAFVHGCGGAGRVDKGRSRPPHGTAPIERAISTAGGIAFDESTRTSCCAASRACSLPARCSIGKRRPAAICCKPASQPATQRRKAQSNG